MKRFGSACVTLLTAAVLLSGCPDEKDKEQIDQGVEPEEGKTADAGQPSAEALRTVREVEPNEKTAQAMELDESCVVEANLEAAAKKAARASDWYKVSVQGEKQVAFEVSDVPEEDVRLVFRDADRNELFYVDSGGVGQGEVYPNLLVNGACYLKVDGAKGGKGGDYRLTVKMSDPVAGEEVEYNGRYSTANDLAIGQSVRGFLSHHRDEDWYLLPLIDLPTGAVLRIDLTGVEGVRFQLVASDREERRPILEAKASDVGEGIVVRNLGLPEGAKAIYLVVKSAWIKGAQPKKFVRTANPKVAYSLSVSSEAGGDDLEREPNGDAQHAMLLADGQKIRGYLSAANDIDWYRIEVEQPSLLSAELGALDRVDLQLYVVDPEKKDQPRKFELVRINDGKVNEPEVLTNCALSPGENYVRVEGAFKNVDGKWVRDFYNLDETYELTLHLRKDEGREEREPNGSTEVATPIAVGDTLRGTMHPRGDVDTYKLDLSSQDGPITTTIECTGIPKVNIALKLLGPEMDDQGKHKAVATSTKGKDEEKEQIRKELMPGEYWVVVHGPRYGDSNTKDQYVLTVTQ